MDWLIKLVDKVFPFAVGKRTALVGAAKGVVLAARAFGAPIPPEVDAALDSALTVFALTHLAR